VEHKSLVKKIFSEVIDPGNCFHCGLCQGLSNNLFKMEDTIRGPIPKLIRKPYPKDVLDLKKIIISCPGRGVPYHLLSKNLNTKKKNKIIGNYNSLLVCSSNSNVIRKKASSGGITRTILVDLIKSKAVDYVCVLDEKKNKVLKFDLLITDNINKIINISQSIYQTTPLLHKLKKLKKNKTYCFVGLPEHIASLRILKIKYPKEFKHIKYLIGLYSGTNMYPGAIEFYLRGNNIKNTNLIKKLNWRHGEWPGKLKIILKNNKILSLKKFYYNYLISFFISKSCLITPDFTAELSDISIGDAWSPKLENKGYGYSVVISRLKVFDRILNKLKNKKILEIKKINLKKTIGMHAHMIEFKKIGSFLRIEKLKKKGSVPLYDLRPINISFFRKFIEKIIDTIVFLFSRPLIKYFFSKINSNIIGYIFQVLRSLWKNASKPTKRKGLSNIKLIVTNNKRVSEFKTI
jgi:coenzyme F420 hydrogenase subunit beta